MGTLDGLILMRITKKDIERYHQGLCSPEERYIVEQWLESDELEMSYPENTDLAAIEDKGWKKISGRYGIVPPAVATPSIKLRDYRMIRRLVACLVLMLGVSTVYYLNNHGKAGSDKGTLAYKVVKTLKG